jgi:hypothetical protein
MSLRAMVSGKTHCRNGHEYTRANCIWSHGIRRCRACYEAAVLRKKARKMAEARLAEAKLEET